MLKVEYKEIVSHLREIIKGSKFEGHVYVVGGAVRSEIMDNNIKDIDLVVDLPNGGIDLANWLEENEHVQGSVVVYPTYGTAMFRLKKYADHDIEVVQTRKEQYKDKNSRNPETSYGTIEEDAMRRDLTINALYYNISTKEYLDITGKGYKDIYDNIIRVTSTPEIVFHDDALRILRCIRFATRFNYTIVDSTYKGMLNNIDRLSTITTERITDEFNKILMSRYAWKGLTELYSLDAFKYIFHSESDITSDFKFIGSTFSSTKNFQEIVYAIKDRCRWSYSEDRHPEAYCNELAIRLNILFRFCNKQELEKLLKGMRYSNDMIKDVLTMHDAIDFLVNEFKLKTGHLYRFYMRKYEHIFGYPYCLNALDILVSLYKCNSIGEKITIDCYTFAQIYQEMRDDLWDRMYFGETMFGYQLPINGEDVMRIKNIGPGKQIKEYLNKVLEHVYQSDHPTQMTKEDCMEVLAKINL